MSTNKFTEDEKRVITRILQKEPGKQSIFEYGVYIAPSVFFAAYGIWKSDYAAVLVAYGALLVVALLFLSYTRNDGRLLYSAVKKYEQATKKLEVESSSET